MKVYLAAAWSRREEIARFARKLEKETGVIVNSAWLFEEPEASEREYWAKVDRDDVYGSDVLVRFTDEVTTPTVPAKLITGSRMWETGYAYANKKPIIVVGGHQCIFDWLPEIFHVFPEGELIRLLLKWNNNFKTRGTVL
jgi:nucleoside 2-deoxyribosyltransferase